MNKPRKFPILLLSIVVLMSFSACTIHVRPLPGFDFEVSDSTGVLTEFQPSRTAYRIGERFEFVVRATEPGYLTVTEYGPNNRANTIIYRRAISQGRTVIPNNNDQFVLTVAAPVGSYRLVARYTPKHGGPDDVLEARYTVY